MVPEKLDLWCAAILDALEVADENVLTLTGVERVFQTFRKENLSGHTVIYQYDIMSGVDRLIANGDIELYFYSTTFTLNEFAIGLVK